MSGSTMRYAVETEFIAIDKFSEQLNKMGASGEYFKNTVGTAFLKAQSQLEAFGSALTGVAFRGLEVLGGGIVNATKEYVEVK